jgi:hypothetical protein
MRSEAQKAADRKYREAHKHDSVKWGTRLKPAEAADYDTLLKQHNMSRADFVRWAIEELKRR